MIAKFTGPSRIASCSATHLAYTEGNVWSGSDREPKEFTSQRLSSTDRLLGQILSGIRRFDFRHWGRTCFSHLMPFKEFLSVGRLCNGQPTIRLPFQFKSTKPDPGFSIDMFRHGYLPFLFYPTQKTLTNSFGTDHHQIININYEMSLTPLNCPIRTNYPDSPQIPLGSLYQSKKLIGYLIMPLKGSECLVPMPSPQIGG